MIKETMIEGEETVLQHKSFDQNNLLHEYETIITSLKEELSNCNLEQNNLRFEIETLRKENQDATETIRRSLTECDHEEYNNITHDKEAYTNLEKRITILQMEKDSVHQLWQMALKTIDVLEEQLRTVHKDDKNSKFYQDQINSIKETYSEAIRMLETKLVSAKENFFQHQTMLEKSKEKIDQLTKEKNDILEQLSISKQQILEKEKSHQETIDSLKETLNNNKRELEQIKLSKINLEGMLRNAQQVTATLLAKDHEAKSKVSEAVDLVESAVKEKEAILRREARVVEEKMKLEARLAMLSEEHTSRLEIEIVKAKEIYNKNVKKYSLEIKELKAELREKGTLLDRSQRECRLAEEELEKIRMGSDNFIHKSNMRISSLEQTLQEKEFKLKSSGDGYKTAYDDRIQYLECQISHLQDKLSNTSEKLRRVQLQSSRDVEDRVREADDRTREVMEKCSNFERQLSRALGDKENLVSNLHTLEISFEKEIQKRNHEKISLENKVRDLQEKIINTESNVNRSKMIPDHISNRKNSEQQTSLNLDSIDNILALREKFDKKTKELTQHVEIHQKLSNKWKEEANSLTYKFQSRTQELKNKISALQKQNEELARELLFYQQLLARCNAQLVQNYGRETESR